MRAWQLWSLCFLLVNVDAQKITSLEEDLTYSAFDPLKDLIDGKDDHRAPLAKFSLRNPSHPGDDLCYIIPGQPETLAACNYSSTSKTFLVIHGWTLSGMFESWMPKLVSALYQREPMANVVVVDWLSSAQNHFAVAAEKTKAVGKEIARFIDWMEESTNMPLEKLHLIGYSLGAHVAGFAGNHARNKVGRITGLDPAGPDFEGEHANRWLSPDDGNFVDVLHTFSRDSLGLGIGMQQPVGHVDIYPNGGSFQPGCNLRDALENIANFGIFVYLYQVKIHFSGKVKSSEMEPSLTISLYGTRGEAENLELKLRERPESNMTQSFLLVAETDIGDPLLLKFKWMATNSWPVSSLLKMVSSWWSSDSDSVPVDKIRIRSGETQKKMVFCLTDPDSHNSSGEVTFIKCLDKQRMKPSSVYDFGTCISEH